MKDEYGLFIIWSNARFKQKEIIEDIKTRFKIMNVFEIKWSKDIFSRNLTRFYGENLPKNSSKEKHCGNDKFLLIIVRDDNAIYSYRKTSKGKKYLNVNFFDSKKMYRNWTGQHMVHGTNDNIEFEHDLMLLLGISKDTFLKKYKHNEEIIRINRDIVGNDGWESLEQIFSVLNKTIEYVVLRNFQDLPEKYDVGEHSDIDILCENRDNMQKILNAFPVKKSKRRSRYGIKVGNNVVFMDLRYIGDNYYDKRWEQNILDTREKNKGFYIPNKNNYRYSLLYHALVQKSKIAMDYKKIFLDLFNSEDRTILSTILDKYMKSNEYHYVDCLDYTVYFNYKTTGKRMRITKIIYCMINTICSKVKRMMNNENND